MGLGPEHFDEFFKEIHGGEVEPFPWQRRLVCEVCRGRWPSPIALPTAAGKTAAIDAAVFALACGVPNAARRIFFVIDRRIVVDEASQRAFRIAERLRQALRARVRQGVLGEAARALVGLAGEEGAEPLLVVTLRGGMLRDDSWLRSPLQPMVCCSTVDQVGSALLFRGYGARSPANWPIQAGLVSHDALFLIDEAHTSAAFVETIRAVAGRYRGWAERPLGGGVTVVELTATPDQAPQLRDEEEDREHPILGPRLRACKPAALVDTQPAPGEETEEAVLVEKLCSEAWCHAHEGRRRIGVIVNRVATARAAYGRLAATGEGECLLLTGRVRPFERERLLRRWRSVLEGALPQKPMFVAATQCVEVGANFDFDALVTEAASLEALQQRFGRLNRFGRWESSPASIVRRQESKRGQEDPIYGNALATTWTWLNENAAKERKSKKRTIDLGVLALRNVLFPEEKLATLRAARKQAPVLLPSHLDVLAQTWPEPVPPFDVSPFLHGPASAPADVTVVWRADLEEGDWDHWRELVAICPPSTGEAVALPFYVVRRWLAGLPVGTMADVEGTQAGEDRRPVRSGRSVLCWRGVEESAVVGPEQVRPGMTLVVPSTYGGCDEFGWNADSDSEVTDLGDIVSLHHRGRAVLRLARGLLRGWPARAGEPVNEAVGESLRALNASLETEEAREFAKEFLGRVAEDHSVRVDVRMIARLLRRDPKVKLVLQPGSADSDEPAVAAIIGSRRWRLLSRASEGDFWQEDLRSSMTVEVGLGVHSAGVEERARQYGERLCLPKLVVNTLGWAGRLHDIGKADPRFQAWLRGGAPWASGADELLGKSGGNCRDVGAIERARVQAGYPKGGRHELESVVLAEGLLEAIAEEVDQDLLLHLIASHHGRCRPFAPVTLDEAPVEVSYRFDGREVRASSRHSLERLDSGVSERYWRLARRYGWFGLAYLETLLRLADQRESELEQAAGRQG